MKAVISYMAVLLSALGYMLLFDRNAGGIMTVFLVVVPVVSVFLTLFSRKKIRFEIAVSDELISKKQSCTLTVKAFKSTLIPVPVVSFELSVSEHFRKPEYDVYRFSMSENRSFSVESVLFPEVCGTAVITVRKICITDYLGIFRFRVPVPEVTHSVGIMAEIHEIEDYSELLRSIYNTLPDNDDEEETSVVYGKTSVPGYGYRNYVPGDPLKRINWKLSSKRNELYVRLDESSGMTLPNIILDLSSAAEYGDKREGLYYTGMITEAALSVLSMCVQNGIECRFTYPREGMMYTENVNTPEEAEKISAEIIGYLDKPCRVTLDQNSGSKSSDVNVICTLRVTDELAAEAEASEMSGNSVKMVIPAELYGMSLQNVSELWLLGSEWKLSAAV